MFSRKWVSLCSLVCVFMSVWHKPNIIPVRFRGQTLTRELKSRRLCEEFILQHTLYNKHGVMDWNLPALNSSDFVFHVRCLVTISSLTLSSCFFFILSLSLCHSSVPSLTCSVILFYFFCPVLLALWGRSPIVVRSHFACADQWAGTACCVPKSERGGGRERKSIGEVMRRGGVDYCLEALGLGGREQGLGCVYVVVVWGGGRLGLLFRPWRWCCSFLFSCRKR